MEARSTSTRSPSANTCPAPVSSWVATTRRGTLQLVEAPVGVEDAPGQEALQSALDLDSFPQGEDERGHAAVHLQGQEGAVVRLVLLQGAPRGAQQRVQEGPVEVHPGEQVLDLPAREAAGHERAHQGSGAGAGDAVHRDPLLLEPLDHADVGHAAGPAAAQDQGQAGPPGQVHPGGEVEQVSGGVTRTRMRSSAGASPAARQATAAAAASILLMLVVGKNGP